MPAGSTLQTQLLKLLLAASGNPITNIAATAGATVVWAALHTADPAGGTAGTNEVTLTGYTRISVDRSTATSVGWTVSTSVSSNYASASPNGAITFPILTSTSTGTATHWSVVVTSATTAGQIIASGTLSPNINLGQNVTPQITTGSSVTLT